MNKALLGLMFLFLSVSAAMGAQHDYVIGDQPGAAFRSDLNAVLQAIVTNNSSATEPATLYPNMWWYDSSAGLLKHRNNANDAWITLGLDAASTDGTFAANSDSLVPTQKAAKTYADNLLKVVYPVGSIYISTASTNPATLFGFGTWTAFAAGRVMVGKAGSGTFATAGATGGEETHSLSEAEGPPHLHGAGSLVAASAGDHAHNIATNSGNKNGTRTSKYEDGNYKADGMSTSSAGAHTHTISGSTGSTGSGTAHNNLQPYIVVYMWQRTA